MRAAGFFCCGTCLECEVFLRAKFGFQNWLPSLVGCNFSVATASRKLWWKIPGVLTSNRLTSTPPHYMKLSGCFQALEVFTQMVYHIYIHIALYHFTRSSSLLKFYSGVRTTAFFEWQDWWELIPKQYWVKRWRPAVSSRVCHKTPKIRRFFICIALKDLTQKPRSVAETIFFFCVALYFAMFHCGAGSQLTIILGITSTTVFPTLRSIENRWGLSGSAMTEAREGWQEDRVCKDAMLPCL